VLGAAVLILVAGGAVWAWPDSGGGGGDAPPEPFQSAELYELARHHFGPSRCIEPQSREEAPLAWTLPHTELVWCDGSDSSYSGTFLCASDRTDLATIRQAYLDEKVDEEQPVTDPPAGRDEPWPYQVAFHHENNNGGRVYWEDPDSLCAAQLRVHDPDLSVVLDLFVTGEPG
jgi:hypothetical protein